MRPARTALATLLPIFCRISTGLIHMKPSCLPQDIESYGGAFADHEANSSTNWLYQEGHSEVSEVF